MRCRSCHTVNSALLSRPEIPIWQSHKPFPRECPICKTARKPSIDHYPTQCKYLSENGKALLPGFSDEATKTKDQDNNS